MSVTPVNCEGGAAANASNRMAMAFSCSSALLPPLYAASPSSHWKPVLSHFSGKTIEVIRIWSPLSLRVRAAAQKQKRGNAETPNIPTPPLPVGTTPLEAASDEEAASSSGQDDMDVDATSEAEGASKEKQLRPEEIGQQLKALRISRGEVSTSPQDFWSGVWEETKLVEWPQLKKVSGTTGVVVGIIFGSSILLLTVNAVLAEVSDQVFNGSSEFAKSWTRGF